MVQSDAKTVEAYLDELPDERRAVMDHVRQLILKHLPEGYQEAINWGMISYEIPLDTYPETYNRKPLGYLALAAQKNHYALYMMCIYQDPELEKQLKAAYEQAGMKLNMGKSCLRFKSLNQLHEDALAEIISQTPPGEFIARYEHARK